MGYTLGLNRLGITFIALSILSAFDVSFAQQSEALASKRPESVAVNGSQPAINDGLAAAAIRESAERFLKRRSLHATNPAEMLVRARRQHALLPIILPADATSPSTAWQPLGPNQVISPYFGKVTGRVTSLAIDPSDTSGNTVYVGTTGGGVWKSTNAASSASQVSFTPQMDTLPTFTNTDLNLIQNSAASLSIGAISIQPGGTGVLLVGTGDPNDALDSYFGAGVLRSVDNGVTWDLISGTYYAFKGDMYNYSFMGNGFSGFSWSTVSPNLVVAAVADALEGTNENAIFGGSSVKGMYYSTDAGATWHLSTITDGPNKVVQTTGLPYWGSPAATSVVWNPIRKAFYAALRYHGYYSSPDGVTWTRLPNQPGPQLSTRNCPSDAGGSPNCPIFRGALAVQPFTGDLFAWTVDSNNTDIGLWQDTCNLQSGACASAVAFGKQLSTAALETTDGRHKIVQGTYNLWLAAVPSLSDTWLYTGATDISHCSLLNGCVWRNTTNSTTCPSVSMVSPSQHAVAFLGGKSGESFPGLMYFGNDGGLWRTTDGAQQPSSACSPSDGLSFDNLNGGIGSLAEINGLAQDPIDPSIFLAGLGVNGSFAPSVASQVVWPQVLGGEGATTVIDPVNPQNWYVNTGPGVSIQHCSLGTACTSADFGYTPIGNAQVGGDGLTMFSPAAYVLDALDPSQMLVGTCRVWRGAANGSSWSSTNAISGMLDGVKEPSCNGNAVIRSLAASPSPSGEWIFAGMAGRQDGGGIVAGHLFRAMWNGSAPKWTDVTASPVTNVFDGVPFNQGKFAISSIVPDPHDSTGQTIYATIEGFSGNGISATLLYRSTDAGSHWLNVNSNLPSDPAQGLVIDPEDANTLYVALDTGVYITRQASRCSDTSFSCWSIYGTGLPNAPVTRLLAMAGSSKMLRAGTYGRGIWQIPLAGGQSTAPTTTTATITPASVTFADQTLQTASSPQSLVLTNTGTLPLNVTQVISSSDYSEQNTCSAPVAVQATCTIQVTFIPSQLGSRPGTLTIDANVAAGQVVASLSGNGTKGGAIVLTPSSMDFGSYQVGGSTATQFVTIANMGGAIVNLGAISITGPFTITRNLCGASLAPTYSCTAGVAFSPVVSGAGSGVFSVSDDVGIQVMPLTGIAMSPASDALSPLSLTFPAQVLATNSTPQQVTLTNTGDSALKVISAQTTGNFSVTNNCTPTLTGHSSCTFSVIFHPSVGGQQTGTLTVSDLVATHIVSLSGTGVAPAGISIAPGRLDFAGVGVGSTISLPVTLTNNGAVSLDGIVFGVTGDFAIGPNGCSASLAAGSSCNFQVSFSPTQAGARAGNLSVTSSSATGFNMPLTGSGEDFQLVVIGSASSTVVTGQTAGYTLSLITVAGSSGVVAISCAGAPKNSTCTVSPSSAQLVGGDTVSISVKVVTGTATTSTKRLGSLAKAGRAGLVSLALLFPLGWILRRPRMVVVLSLFLCLFLAPLGCGVSVSGGSPATGSNPDPINSTPAGNFVLTIAATEPGIQKTATLNLTVE